MKIDWDRIPTVTGSRISLRPFTPRDTAALYAIYSDNEVMRYWGGTPMKEPREAARFLDEVQGDLRGHRCLHWGVARRSDDRIIGTVALFHLDTIAQKAELGFALARACWRQGYMSEALQTAIDFTFTRLEVRRLEADVDPRNDASIRLLEKLGFQKEGYLRERWLVAQETQDSMFYGLLSREWRSRSSYEIAPPATRETYSRFVKSWLSHSRLRRWAALFAGVISSF
jgi:RimJ/RimL family protein N-acetyltransferase